MNEQVTAAIIGLVAGTISGFLTAMVTNQFDRRKIIDESVRDVRKMAYASLWGATALLPMWPRATVNTGQLLALSQQLRDWYFGVPWPGATLHDDDGDPQPGGMYLSQEARVAYTEVQNAIKRVKDPSKVSSPDRDLIIEEYDLVRGACSELRTELTADLLSRKRTFLVV
jgi:hypothetical protein